jgi:hypothetical protein
MLHVLPQDIAAYEVGQHDRNKDQHADTAENPGPSFAQMKGDVSHKILIL